MKTVHCATWEELMEAVHSLRPGDVDSSSAPGFRPVPVIFRGQPYAGLDLTTTLERAHEEPFSCDGYYFVIHSIRKEIEAFSGRKWDWMDPRLVDNNHVPKPLLDKLPHLLTLPYDKLGADPPNLDYMIYLRHFGFPSPLLDWTASPLIAAHFAVHGSVDEPWAIFAFDEFPTFAKVELLNGPRITSLRGSFVNERRHFLQQSLYTVCVSFDKSWIYRRHDSIFSADNEAQNVLTKFVLPGSLRSRVKRALLMSNINHYSLFHTEEALVKTLASRTFPHIRL